MEIEQIREGLRHLRFAGEYGFADSLPEDYVEVIANYINGLLITRKPSCQKCGSPRPTTACNDPWHKENL
jgi:hypothetical protein